MIKAPGARRLLVAVAIVVTGLGVAASPATAAPAITVTPATGLLDQQIVTVTGSGFTADEVVVVTQCGGPTVDDCVLDPPLNTVAARAEVDDAGQIEAHLRLERVLELEGGDVSCAGGGCAIAVLSTDATPVERVRTSIDFAATGTAPPPPDSTLSITFPSGIRPKGGRATWTVSGALPWYRTIPIDLPPDVPMSVVGGLTGGDAGAYVALCTSPPAGYAGCERVVGPSLQVPGGGGAFSFLQRVFVDEDGDATTVLDVPRMRDTLEGRIDCAVEDCSIALDQDPIAHSNLVDVAWAPEWAPYPTANAFTTAAYRTLVGRAPTTSERASAVTGLTARSLTGFTFLRQLAARTDGRRLAELTRLYLAALGRKPDASGLVYWADELARTGSISSIAVAFGRSPEFREVFGSVSDEHAVELAYQRTLGRDPFPDERAYWVGRLRSGLARTHMIHMFSRSPEFVARQGPRSEAFAANVALLRRTMTNDEWYLAGPDYLKFDTRGQGQRADDAVLLILSSNQLTAEVGS